MPVVVKENLPAYEILKNEGMFIMNSKRATTQDIRPLEILIFNLMPEKEVTETQLLRFISNSIIQVNVTLLKTESYESKNTSKSHLMEFYNRFEEIKDKKFDGMIITGAPVEQMNYEQVEYWEEYKRVLNYSQKNVTSTIHICWAAMATLYIRHGIEKVPLEKKLFGVFNHRIIKDQEPLLNGLNDEFLVPHSRHTGLSESDISKNDELTVLVRSKEAGSYLIIEKDYKNIYITGHSEYDNDTLEKEYKRDINSNFKISMPLNYYPDDNPDFRPVNRWKSSGNTIFNNWLNYCVYQITKFEL